MYVFGHKDALVSCVEPEDNLEESILSFHHGDPGELNSGHGT